MSSHLIDSLATTTELADVFSDRSLLQAMLDFEIALAQAEAAVGLIPRDAAAAIASSTIDSLDAAEIGARGTQHRDGVHRFRHGTRHAGAIARSKER